ncbi:glycoside hydrolase family 43 protein [Plebeiibacterium marinum]|uniref:Glycoside hydrolase family 43 protein n=1 Tax=Plebeiibacterium marinum TaxID=2992111 RepID=A0AAE3MG66_9BACT|nr:glycoside hydrolase family 43 protein [Plebeiobacterium marinum]MCW3807042.1 glycoside hydrolase family 43 protein [Plebeiobacterium marinum]
MSLFGQKVRVDLRNPFEVISKENAAVTYNNPVIPGFYSDPSVCRVGEDYYLITSTFEYFPGVPVFHSKDLVNWEQIGYCIDRIDQLPKGMNIYAPTLRYHKGIFYMITTNAYRGGNFIVTAKDPSGPWSDPIWINTIGIDPDLFFDDDGKVYLVDATMYMYEIDINTGELLSEGRKIWNGSGGRYAEGPHIYKKDGYYYLMASEGGTEECHSETIARSHNIWGPYIENPANPILAHANAAGEGKPIQGVGHADLVQAHDDSWWMVFHGYRSIAKEPHHILGRETCLAPVIWPKNGWPVVNGNGTIDLNMTCPTLPLKPLPTKQLRTDFSDKSLGLEWNYIQLPEFSNYTLVDRQGFLRLKGSAYNIGEKRWKSPTFVGRRLQDLFFTATTRLEFEPKSENEEAGLILLNNGSHFDIMVMNIDGKKCLVVKLQFGSITYKTEVIEIKPGPVDLRIIGQKSKFTFSYSQNNDDFTDIESVDSKFLSSETAGRYTGVYVGLYATGNGKTSVTNADFDWFEYIKVR